MATIEAAPTLEARTTKRVAGRGLPDWIELLWRPRRYKVVRGGRGSSKSWTAATALLLLGAQPQRWGYKTPLNIWCMREVQESIEQSSKKVLDEMIEHWGLHRLYRSYKTKIVGVNGTEFHFRGMSDVTSKNVFSTEGIDIIWFEQAEYMSRKSASALYPTIRRAGSELWFTFNPRLRQDPVWVDFCTDTRRARHALVLEVNFDKNPWFTDAMEEERLNFLEDEPDRYAHIYLGVPDDEGTTRKVITYAMAHACVEAWDRWALLNKYDPTGHLHVGFDPADTGANKNAMVARRGPLINFVDEWAGSRKIVLSPDGDPEDAEEMRSIFTASARRVDMWCREHGASRMFYDGGGIGGPLQSIFRELRMANGSGYRQRGIKFGAKVAGPTVAYTRSEKNEDHFAARNSQLWWNLHLRARRTQRLLDGADVNPEHCLFIDKKGVKDPEKFLTQLSQPEWEETTSGKIKVEKEPKMAEGTSAKQPSPDQGDSAALSFAAESMHGLKSRR